MPSTLLIKFFNVVFSVPCRGAKENDIKKHVGQSARNRSLFFVLLWYWSFVTPLCAQDYLKESQSHPFGDTLVTVDVCYVDGRQDDIKMALDRVWKRIEEVQRRTDSGNPHSEVVILNAAGGASVKVSEDVYRLLDTAHEITIKSDGMFDVTVAPIVNLWRRAEREGSYPSLSMILDAKKHVGIDKLELGHDGRVRLLDPSSRIHLGDIAPSFAVDEAVSILKQAKFFNFFINAGGCLYVAGVNCQGKAWRIVIQDPDRPGKIMDVVELADAAISSSGDNANPMFIQGKRWSHIVNPMTGYPQNGMATATVIAPSAVEANALSQALCILGPNQGLRFIRELAEGYDALMLFRREGDNYEWHSTAGYEDRRVNQAE